MRHLRARLVLLFSVIALLLLPLATATADVTARQEQQDGVVTPVRYYLSLGDSVAAGWQPDENGEGHYTRQGYTDVLFRRLQENIIGLRHVKLGCPGETTASMITGEGSYCTYPRGSQLEQARAFLLAHLGEVELITIDIGVNDVLACPLDDPEIMTCLQGKFAQIHGNLPEILDLLRLFTGGQVPIVGMNYYDPYLASWLMGEAAGGPQQAHMVNDLLILFNGQVLEPIFAAYGVPVADVFDAFHTMQWNLLDGIPANVRRICRLTWMCADPPQGPDIHPNRFGHRLIASAFEAALEGL